MATEQPPFAVTHVLQLRQLVTEEPTTNYSFQLEAGVCWARPAQGKLVLHDDSGTEEIEMDLRGQTVKSGDRVRLTGTGTIVRKGAAFQIGASGPVVENDGIHSMTEMSGAVYLFAGRHPFGVDWFNGVGRFGLGVEYEGCGLSRQRVPDSALLRNETGVAGGGGSFVKGVDYQCYEGTWQNLPDFSLLTPVKTGVAHNFDLGLRTRDNYVGLRFRGYLEVSGEGMYRFYLTSDDGSRLFVGEPTLQLNTIGEISFPPARRMDVGQLLPDDAEDGQWAQVEGKVTSVKNQPEGMEFELRAGAGSMRVEVGNDTGLSAAQLLNSRIRATGFCQACFDLAGERVAGALLVPGGKEIHLLESAWNQNGAATTDAHPKTLPMLTTASAVRELRPEEARRGYPVWIQGVVTCIQPDQRAFVIQDSTIGLRAVESMDRQFDLPSVGDFLEVEGVTDEPGIAKLDQIRHLGRGALPEPAHPAWDQLMNGSLDSQWVEIGGLVESLIERPNGWSRVMLRTRAGVLKADVRKAGVRPGPIEQYENAVVRLRGCMFADWLPNLRLKVGQIRMYDVNVSVDQPAPEDLFSVPSTTPAALMRFDPAFDISRLVKVAVQVVYVRGSDYFTMDGADGLRFLAQQPLGMEEGDLVEVVGYPELSGAAPVLRGAVARKTGHAPLPAPRSLSSDDLTMASLDSTRVRVEGWLTGMKQTRTNLVLEMQAGSWRFLARLNTTGPGPSLSIGSLLRLTGVYCAQGGYQALGADVAQVDLLLSAPSDITVLARPPWWTFQRLLVILGVLACALAVMVLWITQLRRQVEERTAELEIQIENRHQLEHQRTVEQERTRIAQDLHDQLGSDIAAISMLAARAKFASAPDEKRNEYLDQVRGMARKMVAALDEIVWAMNPVHDSLASLESYLGRYADRFLGLANIAWRLEGPPGTADCPVDSQQRYQLFLAYKEALTNVVRHSAATEVRVSLQVENRELRLAVADNGRGLPSDERTEEMNGVANMRARIQKLHGNFEIISQPGAGTTVRFSVPLI
jgi:signal transduction histidine kinase